MKDLRDFLRDLKEQHPEEFVEIDEPVSTEYEVTAYWQVYSRLGNPVLFFRKVRGYDMPVVANVFGSRRRVARVIGADEEGFYDKWCEKLRRVVEPEVVNDGSVKEVRQAGDEVDLTSFPIQKFFKEDAGRYITSGVVVANHPETGVVNLSFARMQLKGKNKLGVSLHSRGYLW
ncbi:MAG: UbiD family decarboxylase, partial [Candidatus Caldarchaeum sp.]